MLWIAWPGFAGFATGFVLWGIGSALSSGAFEALVYDGLSAAGAEQEYPRINGRLHAAGLLAQILAGVLASGLYAVGGYPLVGWVSVGCCLASAGLATQLPEAPHRSEDDTELGYLRTLQEGLTQASTRPGLPMAVLAVAALGGIDAIEEYFPLVAADLGFSTTAVPLAILAIPLVGAAGAALGGVAARLGPMGQAGLLLLAAAGLAAGGLLRHPTALLAVAVFYGLYRASLVVAENRLQQRTAASTRATVTSVAAVGTEICGLAMFGVWALGGPVLVAGLLIMGAILGTVAARRDSTLDDLGELVRSR